MKVAACLALFDDPYLAQRRRIELPHHFIQDRRHVGLVNEISDFIRRHQVLTLFCVLDTALCLLNQFIRNHSLQNDIAAMKELLSLFICDVHWNPDSPLIAKL